VADLYIRKVWVSRLEERLVRAELLVAFDRKLTVEERQYNSAICFGDGAVDNGDVTWENTDPDHAFARDFNRKGGFRVGDQDFVEIKRAIRVIVGRRRKTVSVKITASTRPL